MKLGYYILDENKKPVEADLITWGKWFEGGDKRRVKLTKLDDGRQVSTVFLGMDHSWDPEPGDAPVLFETMIYQDNPAANAEFSWQRTKFEDYQWRYTTWEKALYNHDKIVELIIKGGDLDAYEPF